MASLLFTVTTDLTYDQRMDRICSALAEEGHRVRLIGRQLPHSLSLEQRPYEQHRIRCIFHKGLLFYAEFNLRLLFYLWFQKCDGLCAIDLDTILPVLWVSRIRRKKRVYDAHEYFTEMKEVRSRPAVRSFWKAVEKWTVPRFPSGYTVSQGIAQLFRKEYGVEYGVVRNLPRLRAPVPRPTAAPKGPYLLYQGAVNEGRGFEHLVPAMKDLNWPLVICGDGNFMDQLKQLIRLHRVEDKVVLTGMLKPEELWAYTCSAAIGLTLAEPEGTNQLLALPNKFFDYLHAGLPQVAMDFQEYRAVNLEYEVALLIPDLEAGKIVAAVRRLTEDGNLYERLKANGRSARDILCWEREKVQLTRIYGALFPPSLHEVQEVKAVDIKQG